jgi:hypothetical protein
MRPPIRVRALPDQRRLRGEPVRRDRAVGVGAGDQPVRPQLLAGEVHPVAPRRADAHARAALDPQREPGRDRRRPRDRLGVVAAAVQDEDRLEAGGHLLGRQRAQAALDVLGLVVGGMTTIARGALIRPTPPARSAAAPPRSRRRDRG